MSTKLYHAFELHLAPADDAAIQAWVKQACDTLVPVADLALRRWQVQEAIRLHDLGVVYGRAVPTEGLLSLVRLKGAHQLAEAAKGVREPDVDVQVQVRLIIDPHDGQIYGLRYVENTALLRAFEALPGVVPAPYQDQTDDLPQGMTEAQWHARRDLWDRLLSEGVAKAGPLFTLVPLPETLPYPTAEDVTTHWTPMLLRVGQVLPEALAQEMALALQAGGEALTMERGMRLAMESFEREHPLRAAMGEQVAEWLAAHPLFPEQLR